MDKVATRNTAERDAVGAYLAAIGQVPLLDAATEVELARAIEVGVYVERLLAEGGSTHDPRELAVLAEQGRRAREQFISANLRLVVSVARKYGWSGLPMGDLIQEGNLGLVRAVEKFDWTKGYKFSTYATWWIRQAIGRAISQTSRTVRLPVHLDAEVVKASNARKRLAAELEREPTDAEVARALDVSVERVAELAQLDRQPVSLDLPVGEEEETVLGDLVVDAGQPDPEEAALASVESDELDRLVEATLDPRSARVVRARFGLEDGRPRTFAELGASEGLSRERIRQIEREALAALRNAALHDLAA